jgi:hypothetical protein
MKRLAQWTRKSWIGTLFCGELPGWAVAESGGLGYRSSIEDRPWAA